MMLGEEFLARWPTFFKSKVVVDRTNMVKELIEGLLSAH